MRRVLWLLLVVIMLAGCGGEATAPSTRLSAVQATGGDAAAGFAVVNAPREFVFPRDHGAHPEYATEWWYYTGNLDTADGRHFGYQLTFFRFGLAPTAPQRQSDWGATNIYMAHFALSDVGAQQFHSFERFSRGAARLAGATGDPSYRVWLENWSAEGAGANGLPMHLQAAQDNIAIDFTLDSQKPVVLQGPGGVSQKSATPGNASYYYSLTRMPTTGSITINGEQFQISGQSWLDREFGTSALQTGATGWDWFALQLDDGRDLMLARVRGSDGRALYQFGTLVAADGSTQFLAQSDAQIDVLDTWRSPRNDATYPATWGIQVPSARLDLQLTPYIADQELQQTVVYWEGAVRVEGTANGAAVRGNAYIELTGYGAQASDSPQVR